MNKYMRGPKIYQILIITPDPLTLSELVSL